MYTSGNKEGIERTLENMDREFEGLSFTNLVDYDMLYGHRNDVDGYAKALTYFDQRLPELLGKLRDDDLLMITADHGCDPSTPSTDHSREYTPFIMYGKNAPTGKNFGTRKNICRYRGNCVRIFRYSAQNFGGTDAVGVQQMRFHRVKFHEYFVRTQEEAFSVRL